MTRTTIAALTAVVALPTIAALAFVRPSAASAVEPFSTFGVTAVAGGVRTAGDVGASGGLVTLDSGSAFINARLDSAPSSSVLADPVEPGTLVRTVIGQANTSAGQKVLSVPEAEAAYPGRGKASISTVGPQSAGPLTATGGEATAESSPNLAKGTSTGADLVVAGVMRSSGSVSSVTITGSAASGRLSAVGTTDVASVTVAGVLTLQDVAARTAVTATGPVTTSVASLTIGKAMVAGQSVTLDADGAHAAGQNVDASTLQSIQNQVDAVLSLAGVQVRAFNVVHSVTGRSALADSGGVIITVATPDLPGGVTANHLTIALGKVTLTGMTQGREPSVAPVLPPLPPVITPPGVTATPTVAPEVSQPPTAAPIPPPVLGGRRLIQVAGHRMSATTALGAFGCWQLLSLSGATLYALVDRRRRVADGSIQ